MEDLCSRGCCCEECLSVALTESGGYIKYQIHGLHPLRPDYLGFYLQGLITVLI